MAAIFLLLLSSCTGPQHRPDIQVNSIPAEIRQDLTVSGDIRIRGEVKVFQGAVLTVEPGTRFLFEPYDPDGDGVNDSRLVIEGRLVARGEPDAPIFFSSAAENPEPGDWLELRIDRSEGTVLEYCVLEHSRYGLHVHFSSGVVANSIFRDNIDGTRFGTSRFLFVNNAVAANVGKGINLRDSRIIIAGNSIIGNRHGIFIFEQGSESWITGNVFSDNTSADIRFGDFYEGDTPHMASNEGQERGVVVIPDRDDLAALASGSPRLMAGPTVTVWEAHSLWEREIGSFVDGGPVLLPGKRVAVASWKEGITVLGAQEGNILSRTPVGDVVDATPLSHGSALLFPAWDRTFVRLDVERETVLKTGKWPASLADDHRQASPVLLEGKVVQGLWNGELRAMDPWTLEPEWSVLLDGPIRATPIVEAGNIQVITESGTYYLVTNKGVILVKMPLGEPVWSSPASLMDGQLAVVTKTGILKLFRGREKSWSRKLGGPGTYASPIALGQPPLVSAAAADGNGSLYLFDSDGALLWRTELGSAVHTLSRTEQTLWAGTEDGILAALDPMTGRVRLRVEAAGAVHGRPAWSGGWDPVIWAARDGIVRAFELTRRREPWEGPAQ
ncbi:MAG: NosD domain-containing protein [bacterium]|nr:NosD domain-containing protein [bacterium]MDT8394992.1 PQQ-binding-like beta-propeller repeat protein [bacterium]